MDATAAGEGTLAAIWMGATAAVGLLLLLAGGRLLLLMVTLAGGAAGWVAGGALCESLVPEWPPALCAATCAVIGAGLAALFLRPAVALLLALAGTVTGLLVAGALIEGGLLPTGRAPYGASPTAAVEPSAASGVRDARSSALASIERALSGGTDRAAPSRASSRPAEQLPPPAGGPGTRADDSAIVTLARAGMQVWRDLSAAWDSVPPQARTLLAASAGAGGIAGLVLGLLFSTSAMSGVSSLVGAMLLCGAGLPLAERISGGAVRAPESPTGWLLLVTALAVAGWAFQAWRRRAAVAGSASA
jgi:hypothetical protein